MKILIADDSPDMRFLFMELLGSYHRIMTAENGHEAMAIMRTEQVDWLITDYHMPQLNGAELIEKIAEEKIMVGNVLLISSDLPFAFVLGRLKELSHGRFNFLSAEKDSEGFELIKCLK